jgi:hypothetical protein
MQQVWLALLGGLILGWLIEWIIDWQFWRRNVAELREENQALRRQLADAQAQLAALQPAGARQPTKATIAQPGTPAGVPQGAGAAPATPPKQATTPGATAPGGSGSAKPNKSTPSAPPADPRNKGK